MKFRVADEKDLDGIEALILRLLPTPGCPFDEYYPKREHFEESLRYGGLYVIERDGRIVGTVALQPAEEHYLTLECWNKAHKRPCVGCRLGIDPDEQGHHLVTSFLQYALDDATRRFGYDGLRFLVKCGNDKALHVYERAGFRHVDKTYCYEDWYECYEAELPMTLKG